MCNYVDLESQNNLCNKIIGIIKSVMNSVDNNELDKRLTVINIVGEEGSGKTFICKKILSMLNEWQVHYILCDENELFGSGIRTTKKRRESFPVPSVSINMGIFSLGLSQRFQEADSIFNDIEKQFIKEINSDYGKSLIFVENLDRASELTRKFVATICNESNVDRFYKNFPIVFIITSKTKITDRWIEINVENLNESEIISLGEALNCEDIEKHASKLKNLTDGNIDFIINLLKSKDDSDADTIDSIIDKRLNDICNVLHINADTDIEDICICGAYFENGFTVKQINKIFPAYSEDFILKLFIELDKKRLLKNEQRLYKYSVEQFKEGLMNRRINYASLYFSRMYSFYTNYYDENYLDRLKLAILYHGSATEDLSKKIEALLFKHVTSLIYGRRITTAFELQKILSDYSSIQLDNRLLQLLNQLVADDLCRRDLYSTSYVQYDKLIQSEVAIIELNYLSRINAMTEDINNALNCAIMLADQLEAEQQEYFALLQLRLTIVSVLLNRSTLSELREEQINNLNRILNIYRIKNNTIYLEYIMRQNRKSSIYHPCDRSIRELQDAADYFESNDNIYEQFFSYVNLIGMFAITFRYDTEEFREVSNKLNQLCANNESDLFNGKEKMKHNFLLADFLNESHKTVTSDEYKRIAEKYYKCYYNLYKNYKIKTSRLNMVSLHCLFDISAAQEDLNRFLQDNAIARNFDSFYEYCLNDIQCLIFIIEKEWAKAEQVLMRMKEIPLPTFNNCQVHLTKRMEAYSVIIGNEVVCCDIREYDNLFHKIFAEGMYGLPYFYGIDESWGFYSKGFLLTDAQYFS